MFILKVHILAGEKNFLSFSYWKSAGGLAAAV